MNKTERIIHYICEDCYQKRGVWQYTCPKIQYFLNWDTRYKYERLFREVEHPMWMDVQLEIDGRLRPKEQLDEITNVRITCLLLFNEWLKTDGEI